MKLVSTRQKSSWRWLIVIVLFFSSAATVVQSQVLTQSYGQLGTPTARPTGGLGNPTWTQTGPPGLPTTWMRSGNRTGTQTGSSPPPLGNQSATWSHMATQTWTRFNQTWVGPPNQTWTGTQRSLTWTVPLNQTWTREAGNQTHVPGGLPPGLPNGWAQSNMTIDARNITQPVQMNGTDHVRLGYVAINSSSSGQLIRSFAFNESIAQVELDHNGSIELIVNSSSKPTQVYADNLELAEAQSLRGLTPESEAWVYDQNTHTLAIFADPISVTIVYAPIATPVPEFSAGLELALFTSLALSVIIAGRRSTRRG